MVERVIEALTTHGAITSLTLNPVATANTRFVVAAGGFEGATNPSYVFTLRDSGPGAVSMRDVNVLDNALGYVLNQGVPRISAPTSQGLRLRPRLRGRDVQGTLSGDEARQFFDRLGTIDAALWSGLFAGFTQIDFATRRPTTRCCFCNRP